MKPIRLSQIATLLVIFVILGFSSLVSAVVIAIYGGGSFYSTLPFYIAGAIFALLLLWILGMFSTRTRLILLASTVTAAIVIISAHEIDRSYTNSFSRLTDNEVDLRMYEPLVGSRHVAKLDAPATLLLRSDLPRLDGATALYPVYSSFVEATYPPGRYPYYDGVVQCSTTSIAFKRLLDGEVDVIFCAQPSQQQVDKAKEKGLFFHKTAIGKEAFVFFNNMKNPVEGLTDEQIKGIYSGKIRNWKEVGGETSEIRAFQRPKNSGSQTILEKLMSGSKIITPPQEEIVEGMGGIIQQTAAYRNFPNGIGYSFLFFATEMVDEHQIRLLRINGVKPERSTIADRTYPYVSDFYAITTDRPSKSTQALIQWILGDEGQELVERSGYTREFAKQKNAVQH